MKKKVPFNSSFPRRKRPIEQFFTQCLVVCQWRKQFISKIYFSKYSAANFPICISFKLNNKGIQTNPQLFRLTSFTFGIRFSRSYAKL